MDVKEMIALIRRYESGHKAFCKEYETSLRYYKSQNEILDTGANHQQGEIGRQLHKADNRVPSGFHALLVDQKAAYAGTYAPVFDVGNQKANDVIAKTLGEKWQAVHTDLIVDASNAGVTWIHYWLDWPNAKEGEEDGKGKAVFRYAKVTPNTVIPHFSDDLEHKLLSVTHEYTKIDPETGKTREVYEYWDDTYCYAFTKEAQTAYPDETELAPYKGFINVDNADESYRFRHGFDQVPFIPCYNNALKRGDLWRVKECIDAYDKVFSGFINDLEDVQQVIYVLSGYGGQDAEEFVDEVKKKAFVNLDIDEDGSISPELKTLTIEVPVEARQTMLKLLRDAIFEQGMGVDPKPETYGNASGVALKYLYSLLKLKAGHLVTQFKSAYAELVRAICRYYGFSAEKVDQTWRMAEVNNDQELAGICAQSVGVISHETIVRNHPLVDDYNLEMEKIRAERTEDEQTMNQAFFGNSGHGSDE